MKPIWLIIGIISTGLGVIGIILPGMPGTIFIIVGAIAFSKSHRRFYEKLKSNAHLGKIINDFEQKRGMPKRAKIMSIVSIVFFSILGSFTIKTPYILILYLTLALTGTLIIMSQKTSDAQ